MLNGYFWTQTELDAIESIWVMGGIKYSHGLLGQLLGLKEIIVSSSMVYYDRDKKQEWAEMV